MRLAFGAAGPQQVISAREARAVAQAPWQAGRLELEWASTADLPRTRVKLGYLMLLCAETALPMGGAVRLDQDTGGQWHLTASGPRLALDEPLWSVLHFGMMAAGRPLRPGEAQFAALHAAAAPLEVTLNYVARDGSLSMATA